MTGTSNFGGSILSQKNKDLQKDLPSKPQDYEVPAQNKPFLEVHNKEVHQSVVLFRKW